jgi:hypothetical protein
MEKDTGASEHLPWGWLKVKSREGAHVSFGHTWLDLPQVPGEALSCDSRLLRAEDNYTELSP